MHFTHVFSALLGFISLAATGKSCIPISRAETTWLTTTTLGLAPAPVDHELPTPAERGLKYTSRLQRRSSSSGPGRHRDQPSSVSSQSLADTPLVSQGQQDLDALNLLAQIAEQELIALVQSQIALTAQLETVKNNIRINTFQSRFSQVVRCPRPTYTAPQRINGTSQNTKHIPPFPLGPSRRTPCSSQ